MGPPIAQLATVPGADIDLAEELGVIRHRGKIQRPADLRRDGLLAVGIGQDNWLTLRVSIGIPGIASLAGEIGVEGVAGMHV